MRCGWRLATVANAVQQVVIFIYLWGPSPCLGPCKQFMSALTPSIFHQEEMAVSCLGERLAPLSEGRAWDR